MPPWEKYGTAPTADGPWSRYGSVPTQVESQPVVTPQPAPMTDRERFESSMPVRFLRGVEGPAISLLKMVGPESMRKQLAEIDALRESGMKKRGDEGFDWMGLMGSMAPGAAIAKGVTKALPAAQTVLGKMGVGAVAGGAAAGAQPLPGDNELSADKLQQVVTGAAVGGAIPAVTQGVKSFLGTNKLNPTELATYRAGQAEGYVVPPSRVNPSGLNQTVESIAGKAAVGQEAALRNQSVTNQVAARELGLPKNTPLTEAVLSRVRKKAGEVYDELANLRPTKDMDYFKRYHDTDLVDQLKTASKDVKDSWKSFWKSGDVAMRERAMASQATADSIHDDLVKLAKANGREDLVKKLAAAKVRIAKAHDVENALNSSTSEVTAPFVGRQLDTAGQAAKSGGLKTIGDMANAFPSVMREGSKVPASGVSGTDALASAMLGGIGVGTSGPVGAGAAALPWIARPLARNLALSPTYQKYIAEGMSPATAALLDAMATRAVGAGGTAAGRAN